MADACVVNDGMPIETGRRFYPDALALARVLWAEIRAGRIDARRFTEVQPDDIRSGRAQITGLTWHHDGISLNQDGTGPMLLLDRRAHIIFGHVGWASTINP